MHPWLSFLQTSNVDPSSTSVEPEQIINSLEEGIRQTVHNEFSLLSLSCSDYLSLQ
ncbi:MAG: hypothetical protein KPI85_05975 [cyanobacterium endosymbiont of Epithemia adnata isolate EadnSB Bon19]